jgi:ATP-dependent Zn protease
MYKRAQRILTERRTALNTLTEQLLKTETLDGGVTSNAIEGTRLAAAS